LTWDTVTTNIFDNIGDIAHRSSPKTVVPGPYIKTQMEEMIYFKFQGSKG